MKLFSLLVALFAITVVASTQAFGFAPVDPAGTLDLCVEWTKAFTGHTDGIMLATAGAAATKEAVEAATEKLKGLIDEKVGAKNAEIQANLDRQIKELHDDIESGKFAGKGVAEKMEESAKRSEENARLFSEIKTEVDGLVNDFQKSVNERLEKLETGPTARKAGNSYVDYGSGLAKAVKEAGISSGDKGKEVEFKFDAFPDSRMRMKDISVVATDVYERNRVPGIVGPGERDLRVRDLLPTFRTDQPIVYYIKETALTDNAGPQSALGATKGETTFNVTHDSEQVRTIAHFIEVPLQILDDIPGLESYVNGRMLFLLEQEVEDQLLYGDDTGQNLNGLFQTATQFDSTLATELSVSSETDIDRIRLAIAQVNAAQYAPSGILINTYNWAKMELTKDGDNRYIMANPFNMATPRLWGLPVVSTTGITSPDFMVGAFNIAAAVYDREMSSVAISTEDGDNFKNNMATIRAESRLCLVTFRPASFVEGDLQATVT